MLSPPRPDEWVAADSRWRPHQYRRPAEQRWDDDGDGNWLFKIALGAVAAAILVPFVVVGLLYITYKGLLSSDLPPEKPSVQSGLTRVYDDAGNQIALLREYDLSLPVERKDIPEVLKQAVIAVEDRRFYDHTGVDDRAILRAIWANITGGGYVEGASTITQQYVRLLYLDPEKTLRRKLKEAAIARRVEKEMSKDEILYRYLDRVYLGSGAYGVGAAAQTYFRKPVQDLTVSEAALLAGLIRLPSVNEPRSNPAGAEAVRVHALDRMLAEGFITDADYAEARAQRVFLADEAYRPDGPATVIHPRMEQQATHPYFVDYVRRYLVTKYGDEKVYRGGLKVHTSINPELQRMAEAAVAGTLSGTSPPLEMSLVSVDPRTGLVRALIGGRDFTRSEVNLALGRCDTPPQPKDGQPFCVDGGGSGRQPGSAFKPFTLATALEKGISTTRVYSGPSSYRFPNCSGTGCVVSNVEGGGYGSLSLRQATAYSVNTVYAQLIGDVGVKDVAETAHRLGLTMINPEGKLPSGEPYGPSLTLGAAEVSPLEMASAFGSFASRGLLKAPSPVEWIEEPNGKILEDNRNRKGERVLREDLADQINDVLGDVVRYGTGRGADIGRPDGVAGKTGTSEDYGDAWFVGYTPELSTAIWMGYSDSRRPLTGVKGASRVYGGTFSAPTWKAYMTEAAPLLNLTDFAKPAPPTTAPRPTNNAPVTAPRFAPPTTAPASRPVITLPPPTTRPPATLPPPSVIYRPPTTRWTPPTVTTPPPTFTPPPTVPDPFEDGFPFSSPP